MQPYGAALIKAKNILDFLSTQNTSQTLKAITTNTGLNKATAFKLLETLQLIGYVEKKDDSTYRLGLGLLKLAKSSIRHLNFVEYIDPFLKELNEETGETVHFGALDQYEVVYLSKFESNQVVRMHSKIGNSSPLYCTGVGKSILAHLDECKTNAYFQKVVFEKHTDRTITSVETLREEIQRIRKQGYSVDNCEHEEDVMCIAVPVTADNRVYAASISAPSYRMTDEKMSVYLELLKKCQHKISNALYNL